MFKHRSYALLITLVLATLMFGCSDTKDAPEPTPGDPELREQYPGLDEFHVLRAVDYDEMIALLEGDEVSVIYFGWSTCPWCARYVPYFDEVARQKSWSPLYKFDIRETRQSVVDPETGDYSLVPEFQAIVDILGEDNINTIDLPSGCEEEECQTLPWFTVPSVFVMQEGTVLAQRIGAVPGHQRVDGELPPMSDEQRATLVAEMEALFDTALQASE